MEDFQPFYKMCHLKPTTEDIKDQVKFMDVRVLPQLGGGSTLAVADDDGDEEEDILTIDDEIQLLSLPTNQNKYFQAKDPLHPPGTKTFTEEKSKEQENVDSPVKLGRNMRASSGNQSTCNQLQSVTKIMESGMKLLTQQKSQYESLQQKLEQQHRTALFLNKLNQHGFSLTSQKEVRLPPDSNKVTVYKVSTDLNKNPISKDLILQMDSEFFHTLGAELSEN